MLRSVRPLRSRLSPGSLALMTLFVACTTTTTAPVTISPSASPAPATASPTSTPDTRVRVGEFAFEVVHGASVDVYVEQNIVDVDATTTDVAAAAARVEANYKRAFARRPSVYVFRTKEFYVAGVQALFGVNLPSSAGFTQGDRVAVHGAEVAMHELTHVMLHQIAGNALPAWFDEGAAYLDHWESLSPYVMWFARHTVASQAVVGTLRPVQACGPFSCGIAMELLRAQADRATFVRLVDRVATGVSLESAYNTVYAPDTLNRFFAAWPARARSLASTYPGIALLPDKLINARPYARALLYGFPPGTRVTVTVLGGDIVANPPREHTIGADGTSEGSAVGSGALTVTATWPGGRAVSSITVP